VRTVFNILGPLTNPAGARRQVLGVFDDSLVPVIAGVLNGLGAVRAMVVHSADGMDELSVCDETFVADVDGGQVTTRTVAPEDVGLERSPVEDLLVDSAAESAEVIRGVLTGRPGPARDIVLLNAGAAVLVGGKAESLQQGMEAAAKAVDTGRAEQTLDALVRVSNGGP
jgi:anthranilate phosphoribosyltransferase